MDLGERKGQNINKCVTRRNTVTILEKRKVSSLLGQQDLWTGIVGKGVEG